ncbi:unnamed protein product [marine sediment metagenome]|uniref:Uncharacterized protein n=1 Tax=marine sediment metagenome TaxID=412755 RepID=X1JAP9_9ZZZZ
MRIDKAVELVTQHQKGTDSIYLPDLPDAIRLLIEAGKRLEYCRSGGFEERYDLLPGETEE